MLEINFEMLFCFITVHFISSLSSYKTGQKKKKRSYQVRIEREVGEKAIGS